MSTLHEQRIAEAWARLGISPEEVSAQPQVSHILKKVGGKMKILEFLRGSSEPEARKILALVDDLGAVGGWTKLPMEAFAVAAGLSTRRFLELVSGEVFMQSGQSSALLAAAAHPKVVDRTVKDALEPGAVGSQKLLHQHAGFLPQPKTQFVSMSGGTLVSGDQKSQTVNVTQALPALEDGVKRLSDRFNRGLGQRALPEPEILDAEEED